MKLIKKYWRGPVRIVAVLLCIPSIVVVYFWFYALAPMRRTLDPEWLRRHSTEAYWAELETGIRRFRWGHDDPVGYYADAEFMARAMANTDPDDDLTSCAAAHRDRDFRLITNQDPGFVKYNAFRWLRDSDFNPVDFALSDRTESVPVEIETGLLEYLRLERRFPPRDRAGKLQFGEPDDPYAYYPLPPILQTRFKAGVYGMIFGPPALAAGLMIWSFSKKRDEF